jgi:hypothetical protein
MLRIHLRYANNERESFGSVASNGGITGAQTRVKFQTMKGRLP